MIKHCNILRITSQSFFVQSLIFDRQIYFFTTIFALFDVEWLSLKSS